MAKKVEIESYHKFIEAKKQIDNEEYHKLTLSTEDNVYMTKEQFENMQQGNSTDVTLESGDYYRNKNGQIFFALK